MKIESYTKKQRLDIAYFIGAMQTDGCLSIYFSKSKKIYKYKFEMGVGEKSLPMLRHVISILADVFDRKVSIVKRKNLNLYRFQTTVKQLMATFEDLGITTFKQVDAPDWVRDDINYFGAFLAGVIDGDGNVTIKRKSYPLCYIRIFAEECLSELMNLIEKHLNCETHFKLNHIKSYFKRDYNEKIFSCYSHGFYVSTKNKDVFKKYVLPHLQLEYKREQIANYIETRYNKRQRDPGVEPGCFALQANT